MRFQIVDLSCIRIGNRERARRNFERNQIGSDDSVEALGWRRGVSKSARRLRMPLLFPRCLTHRVTRTFGVFLVIRPEPHVAFCHIFVHPLFPVFEPHIQKWVFFVRRRLLTFQNVRQSSLSVVV